LPFFAPDGITDFGSFESRQIFRGIFYLKQINVITGGPLGAEDPGELPPLPPLSSGSASGACLLTGTMHEALRVQACFMTKELR